MAPQSAQGVASRVRFALTQVVLGIDFSRSALPTPSSPAVVSTEPGPSTRKPHAGGTMKSKKLTCIAAMIGFVALAIPFQLTAQQTRYTVTSLGTLGGNNSFAQGINNRGEVVGVAETPDTDPNCECPSIHASLWNTGILPDRGS